MITLPRALFSENSEDEVPTTLSRAGAGGEAAGSRQGQRRKHHATRRHAQASAAHLLFMITLSVTSVDNHTAWRGSEAQRNNVSTDTRRAASLGQARTIIGQVVVGDVVVVEVASQPLQDERGKGMR